MGHLVIVMEVIILSGEEASFRYANEALQQSMTNEDLRFGGSNPLQLGSRA